MIAYVFGGAASGKSEVAESMALALRGPKAYIATLEPYDGESEARIAKHVRRRERLCMRTLECFGDLRDLALDGLRGCMLEDTGNLVGNLLYHYGEQRGESLEDVTRRLDEGLGYLFDAMADVIVVGNDVFGDGDAKERQMQGYMTAIAHSNRRIADAADAVVEVVCGIPLAYRGARLLEEAHVAGMRDFEGAAL